MRVLENKIIFAKHLVERLGVFAYKDIELGRYLEYNVGK
uniref:Uncharacterized protein n=1 Tax=Siphoviridae sp. ctH3Y19 TaxID=2825419 RepID=A0A8S5P1A3_9CAUD|nr:MAG TPA: hypothetical protein [Siphoviridae sp. ctH3Y19]